MRSVVVTGVSTGIGRAAAKLLLERGFHLSGSARSAHDVARLHDEFGVNLVLSHPTLPAKP